MDISLDQNYNAAVSIAGGTEDSVNMQVVTIDGGYISGGYEGDGYDSGMNDTGTNSGSLLSNWFFVGGVTGGVFLFSILLGIVMARKRIKKGIDIYED